MKLEEYIDNLIENGLDQNHWFMTKQTMSDYYFPFYVGYVVDTYPTKHRIDQNFQRYYTYCFSSNPETLALYPKQSESENTYRNAIVAEFTGLINRDDNQYAHATTTEAYRTLSNYIKKAADIETYRDIVDRQIEKICLNVITSATKFEEVKSVTIFPVVFLYKVLLGLYDKYMDSKLTHTEFSVFIMRTQKYDDYTVVMDLIDQYRKHNYSGSYDRKIQEIMSHQSTTNVRFDALFGSLQNIDYKSNDYYRIVNSQESYNYMRTVVDMFEKSKWHGNTNKLELKKFMQSQLYFKGTIDNVPVTDTLTKEEFKQLINKEDTILKSLSALAEKYGIAGTTEITTYVRLSVVQKAFRDKLIEIHGQKCMMCGIQNRDLLVASHIKPAAQCDIYEKADFNNGFLLCANHDSLFDSFLITFNFYDGHIQISKVLTDAEISLCNLDRSYVLPPELLNEDRRKYLMWHNEEFEKRENNR